MRSRASRLGVLAFLILALLVPMLLFAGETLPPGWTAPQLGLRVVVIVYSAARLAQLVAKGEPRWFSLFFWAFCYVWLGLAAFTQMLVGIDPFKHAVDPEADFFSAVVVLLGMLVWDLMYSIRQPTAAAGPMVRRRGLDTRVVTPAVANAVICASVSISLVLLQRQGGTTSYLRTRAEVSEAVAATAGADGSLAAVGLIRAATQIPAFIALLLFVAVWRFYPDVRRRPWWWVLGGGAIGINLLVNNPLGSSRFWYATVAMGLALTFPQLTTPKGVRLFVAGLIASLAVVFPYADYFRSPNYTIQQQGITQFMAAKLDYDASAQISNGVRRVADFGTVEGHQMLGVVGFLVPRSIWPEKPFPTGELIAEYTGYDFTNLSAPLWVEGYMNFGYFGAILFLGIAGLTAGEGDRRIAFSPSGPAISVILYPPLAVYSMVLLRGALQGTLAQGLAFAGAMFLVSLLCPMRAESEFANAQGAVLVTR